MLSSRGCTSSRASFSIVASPLQNSKSFTRHRLIFPSPMGSAPARRRPPIHYDYPSCLCTRFVDQLYFGLLRDSMAGLWTGFSKKGGTTVQIEASPAFGDE